MISEAGCAAVAVMYAALKSDIMFLQDPPTEADLDQMSVFALILTALLVTLCSAWS